MEASGIDRKTPITLHLKDTTLEQASRIMRDRRVRHLPVCDSEGRVIGMISIGDLNAQYATDQEATIQLLNEYVTAR